MPSAVSAWRQSAADRRGSPKRSNRIMTIQRAVDRETVCQSNSEATAAGDAHGLMDE
jgi:hypothetical protein